MVVAVVSAYQTAEVGIATLTADIAETVWRVVPSTSNATMLAAWPYPSYIREAGLSVVAVWLLSGTPAPKLAAASHIRACVLVVEAGPEPVVAATWRRASWMGSAPRLTFGGGVTLAVTRSGTS